MDSVQDTHLVERALRMAHTLRGDVPDGLVFHADRGTQFTSEKLGRCAAAWASLSLWGVLVCASITRWPSHSGRRLKPNSTTVSTGQPAMPNARSLPTGLKSSTTVGAGTEALGMASPVDFENHTGAINSRKEIAA